MAGITVQGRLYIDGRWEDSDGGGTVMARSPVDGTALGTFVEGTSADVDRAVRAARQASVRLAGLTAWERSRLCFRVAHAIERSADRLSDLLTREQGKPLHTEAGAEVHTAAAEFYEAAEQVKYLETSYLPVADPFKRVFTIRQARGVYGVVTPWNFPINIPCEYLAPALATGNSVVWVPAPTTALCAVALVEAIEEADLPPGAINLVTGAGPIVGDATISHPGVDAVGFTGSPETGQVIARRAAGKPMVLELGGNGPTIVLDDADLDRTAQALSEGCFFNGGQTCAATEWILVQQPVYEALTQAMVQQAQRVALGNPFEVGVTMGPLNNAKVAAKVEDHVQDAVSHGAEVVWGGRRVPELGSPLYFQPTVLCGVSPDMLVSREETFGPVVPLTPFGNDAQALQLAADQRYGLCAAVFTRDIARAFHFAEHLRAGIVNINAPSTYWEIHLPFGGASGTRSGLGRLGGRHMMESMTDLKTIAIDVR